MSWILVTGGVCSGIGKGCVAAMVARAAARAGLPTAYQKLEPCLQGDIAALPNTCFGEVVRAPSGASFDGDVTEQLGDEAVAEACAEVARDAAAGAALAARLEEMTGERCIVAGRAVGRLHPDALARFYLAAPVAVRAARRGCRPAELEERDRRDVEHGRLLPPDIDALLLETASRGPDDLADRALALIRQRLGGAGS